ncbi:gamma-glutamyl phosphate reductase ProA [Thermoclostridium stercorarium subsp. stercorarium DSM 8532]|uniref:Gamma-glutamyl phosphate reductase n=3 Tax=Thermoclostridium stercorarium TaxID=1510 RepID=L7VK82_THES1|nr:glutamate-5-semialdehyde dehydrogenase [Thermoclostridium stercorarium]AGC68545.1 gamma-glutamyl phosphate reductase ProA [Thermoclostridium stercorarium subsp. stercorarium DSM 8532]AGI39561.1 glutamate-5-semialdehyde dehydrogenase [Thermoclostridium stercorarium subsp. stercorarium DSM 8532]ANW98895.1 gamma-glutamyl-phosphate reductase [Thermoclostridium stercorarium subsp. thermolacticum DSM 2910]ANX01422.1 gamma-glutamyl-phosphate reductase [Thermoclostridium stercorarium subsp. leptospa
MEMIQLAKEAKKASIILASTATERKNLALKLIADYLMNHIDEIVKENEEDIRRSMEENLPEPLVKRLKFDRKKILDTVEGIKSLISLPDPVGKKLLATELDEGLTLYRVSCPIGVIGVIFESRPDALVQISTLCLKSGNAVLLKGGREAIRTNRILTELIQKATLEADIPQGWISLLESRDDVNQMLKLDKYIDLIIPRGSNEFVRYIMENSRIPVLGHADGICHCYVDSDADIKMAVDIVNDAKTQYVAVCNATETLLVHSAIASRFLPELKRKLDESNVELRGCERTQRIIEVKPASEEDWRTEYLDYILSVKIVDSIDEAIEHINTYGSGHTDAIITDNRGHAEKFMDLVDSGNVFWNCSTRFSDGFRYGFGAEVGISTSKIHARGPVGLDGLTIYKYKLIGKGHIVADYAEHRRTFKHRPLPLD